ncbi:sulfotransferase family protein [Streptomyces sp. SID8352]|uniref:sulfotransferase-like domain-containing protein n=1 Tax=Streptomyces sp. SID8352 TaxID=2690338 RepID=UPI00136BB6B0|nr:sulfotransferase family protein [Streptomyces sp. SID8352]MYU20501.1 sulfotransferase family protein [Streptomyces sp. SID8352]
MSQAHLPHLLALWSAPRCRSTAFFRMMAERGDFQLLHEPFSYLAEFGSVEVAGELVDSESELLAAVRRRAAERPLFFKDTTDERYPGVLADTDFLREARHTFIVRDPEETIASYYAVNPAVKMHQIGFEAQYELFRRVWEVTGERPVVVEAADLVAAPERTVRAYCEALSLPYVAEALSWSEGSRSEWAPSEKWHRDVSSSRGFEARSGGDRVEVRGHPVLASYLEHHLPFYRELSRHRLGA